MLRPFLGYLLEHGYAWNAEPDAIREYTRQYLKILGTQTCDAVKIGALSGGQPRRVTTPPRRMWSCHTRYTRRSRWFRSWRERGAFHVVEPLLAEASARVAQRRASR